MKVEALSERWRKVQAGKYESPDRNHYARKYEGKWQLWQYDGKLCGRYECWTLDSWHLTLADCQEHAETLEARDASV